MDEAGRDAVLAAVLAQHPDAHVFATSPAGLFVPLPDGLELAAHRPILGSRSAVDLVVPDEQMTVMEAWWTARADGVANCLVRLAAAPDRTVRMHLIDLTHRFGTFIGVVTGMSGSLPPTSLDHAPVKPRMVTVRKDPAAAIIDADPAIELVLGWSAAELVGRRSLELVHPDDHRRAIASWIDMLAAPPGDARRVRLRHLHRDGRAIWFEVTNHSFVTDPQDPHVVADMLDISDEMAAQEALRANEQLLRRLTETLPLGVLQIDAARRVVYQNTRVAVAMGAAVGDTLGDAHLRSTLPGDRAAVDAALTAVLRGDGDVDLEYGYRNPETGVRRIHANLRALSGETGEVTGAIICLTDVTEDRRLRDDLKHQATFDALTGCHNRASTLVALQDFLDDPGSRGTAVMFLDLNGFKGVNDRLGHAAGDRLLAFVADRLRSTVRESDVVGRFGGDEFVVVCHDVAGADRARRIAESVVATLHDASLDVGGVAVEPQASIGLAWTAAGPAAAESLIARADAAMYEAKRTRTGRLSLVLADA